MSAPSASSLIAVFAAAATTAAADEVQRSYRFDATGIEHLHIEHRAGELILEPAAGDQIEVELRIEPQEKSREPKGGLAGLDLASSIRGNRLTLSFGEPEVRSHMRVRLPALEQLTIDAGAGEIQGTLPPMEAEVRLGAGTVELDVDRASTGRIDLRALVGDTGVDGLENAAQEKHNSQGRDASGRVLLVGSKSSAVGEGSHRVQAKVRAGEIRVALR